MAERIVIDTDIGDDIDDAYALAFALNSPGFDIQAVITNNRYEEERARIAHELIRASGRDIPVFEGVRGGRGGLTQKGFAEDSRFRPRKLEKNIGIFRKIFREKITYVSIGSLTNVRYLMDNIPRMSGAKFFIMGGTIGTDPHGRKRVVSEWNMASDAKASRKVFESAENITMAGLDSTWNLELSDENVARIRSSGTLLNIALDRLHTLWKRYNRRKPILYDPFTMALVADRSLAKLKTFRISVDRWGRTVKDPEGRKVTVAMKSDRQKFMKLFMKRILG